MYVTKVNNTLPIPQEEGEQSADGASWSYASTASGIVNSTAAVPIKAAQSVTRQGSVIQLRNYLTALQISTGTLGAASELVVLDGATVIWRTWLVAGANVPYSINIPEGAVHSSPGAALNIQTLTATGAGVGVYVNAQGYTGL